MFTLDMNKQKRFRQSTKTSIVYLAISIFCFIFNAVYSLFSHGVSADAMTYLYLIPLLGGSLPFLLLRFLLPQAEASLHYRFFYNCYHSGIALLTTASMLLGIFEIAGTSSSYLSLFYVLGGVMIVISLAGFFICRKKFFSQIIDNLM